MNDPSATETLGAALATAFLRTGITIVFYLLGELGAGKTTTVRGLLRTLGVQGSIRSPSYSLVELYELGAFSCAHVDLYRLASSADVHELGLRDYLGECMLLIEWPERGGSALPAADLILKLDFFGNGRTAEIHAPTPYGSAWLKTLAEDASLSSYVSNLT